MSVAPLVSARGIAKSFAGVEVLRDVDLDLMPGEIHALLGENGAGKSNILRAIRLLLDDNMVRAAYRLEESDFSRALDQWKGHWIIISIEFEDLSQDEAVQALFLHGTAGINDGPISKATYNLRTQLEIAAHIVATEGAGALSVRRLARDLGTSPDEAYFVRCDRSTMTQNDLDNGRLICLIGVAIIKPAEFVIFRIGQKTADARE